MSYATAATAQHHDPDLFDLCAGRHGGEANSAEANRRTDKARDRAQIIAYLRGIRTDAICDDIERFLGLSHQTASARWSELKRDGIITPTVRRATRSGSMAQAWKLKAGV